MKHTKGQYSLKVSLHGMNDRIQKMMVTYLKLACNGHAQVAEESEAEVEIIDVDLSPSTTLLQERKAQSPPKPLIVLSLQDILSDDIIFIKKPLEVEKMLDALATARKNLSNKMVMQKETTDLRRGSVGSEKFENSLCSNSSNLPEPTLPRLKSVAQKDTVLEKKVATERAVLTKGSPSISKQLVKQQVNMEKEVELVGLGVIYEHENDEKIIAGDSHSFAMAEPAFSSSGEAVETFFDRQVSSNKKSFFRESVFLRTSKNRRQTTRYIFRAINGYLIKRSLLGGDNDLPVLILIISSKGALVRLNEPLKLGSKVTLGIKFSLQNTFSIPAEVVRESNKNMYGLAFAIHQQELTNYLINSGRPFKF